MNSDVHNFWPFVAFAPFEEPQVHNYDGKRACPSPQSTNADPSSWPDQVVHDHCLRHSLTFFECDRVFIAFLAAWPTIGTNKKEGQEEEAIVNRVYVCRTSQRYQIVYSTLVPNVLLTSVETSRISSMACHGIFFSQLGSV